MAPPDSLSDGCLYTPLFKTKSTLFLFLDHQIGHATRFNARGLLYEFVCDDLSIFLRRFDLLEVYFL